LTVLEDPDAADAAGGGAVALLEGRERRGGGRGVVEERVALEGNVIVAQAEDGAEIRRDVEDILQVKRVGFDADAGGLLEWRGGAVADVGVEQGHGRDRRRDVAGGAAADLVVALEDGADEQAVGVAGNGLLDREIETVSEEDVVAVDEREGAARDAFGDGFQVLLSSLRHLRSWVAT